MRIVACCGLEVPTLTLKICLGYYKNNVGLQKSHILFDVKYTWNYPEWFSKNKKCLTLAKFILGKIILFLELTN